MSERDELIECLRVCGACHGCGIGADGDTCTNCGDERQLNRLAASLLERDGAELERLRTENAALRSSIEGLRDRKTVLEQHFDAAVADMVAYQHSDLRAEVERLRAAAHRRGYERPSRTALIAYAKRIRGDS